MARLSLNKVELGGNLTEDPELVTVGGSKQVCNVTVAVNERYRTRDDEQKEETTFIELSAWDKLGERLAKLQKGDNVYIDGRLKLDQWERDGDKRQKHRVTVQRFQYLGDRRLSDNSDDSNTEEQSAPADSTPKEEGNPFNSEVVA